MRTDNVWAIFYDARAASCALAELRSTGIWDGAAGTARLTGPSAEGACWSGPITIASATIGFVAGLLFLILSGAELPGTAGLLLEALKVVATGTAAGALVGGGAGAVRDWLSRRRRPAPAPVVPAAHLLQNPAWVRLTVQLDMSGRSPAERIIRAAGGNLVRRPTPSRAPSEQERAAGGRA